MRNNKHRRVFSGLLILSAAVAVLILRLAWVQLIMKEQTVPGTKYTLAKMAEIQSERETVLDSGRGRLYDRKNEPLAGKPFDGGFFPQEEMAKKSVTKVVYEEAKPMHRLAEILGVSYEQLLNKRSSLKEPFLWPSSVGKGPLALSQAQAEEVSALGIDGVGVLPFARRYDGISSGRQWLGYLSEATMHAGAKASPTGLRVPMTGTDGLEKTLEPLLQGVGHTEAYVQVDARGNRLPGSPIQVKAPGNPYFPLSLYTTIDKKLQEGIEELALKSGMKEGAIVVLDTGTGDIEAMVSLPFYNPEKISPQGGEWNTGHSRLPFLDRSSKSLQPPRP